MLRAALFRQQKARLSGLPPTIREILVNPVKPEKPVTARGHIKSIRNFKHLGFLDLSDGSLQKPLSVVLHDQEGFLQECDFKVGQSIAVRGDWVESKGNQLFELQYDPENPQHSLELVGDIPAEYPIQKKRQSFAYLRTLPTLRHRTGTLASIMRFRSNMERVMMEYFAENNFVKVAPPMITSTDCEGAGEMFQVEPINKREEPFFGKDAYLTVSTQLHLEVLAQSLTRVWSLSPCFRAENSNTNRHLSEFWMLEAEMCNVERVDELTAFVEHMLRLVVTSIKDNTDPTGVGSFQDLLSSRYSEESKDLVRDRFRVLLSPKPWPSITYSRALELIRVERHPGRRRGLPEWGDTILTEQEKWLAGEYFQSPVFITDYPAKQKPFYMPRSQASRYDYYKPTVACFDLILPEMGELVGGSIREHRYDELMAELKFRRMLPDAVSWYLDTRKYGTLPHGGFGLGFERLIAYLAGIDSIKDVAPFPRAPSECAC